VRDRHGELDVPHALAPHLGQRDLHAALVADHAAVADALELAAVALPVLDRTEDPLAEEPVPLRLEGAVVDGLGLRDLTEAPPTDLVRGGDLHLDEVEVRRPGFSDAGKVDHVWVPSCMSFERRESPLRVFFRLSAVVVRCSPRHPQYRKTAKRLTAAALFLSFPASR
jgi:hypothetical protein